VDSLDPHLGPRGVVSLDKLFLPPVFSSFSTIGKAVGLLCSSSETQFGSRTWSMHWSSALRGCHQGLSPSARVAAPGQAFGSRYPSSFFSFLFAARSSSVQHPLTVPSFDLCCHLGRAHRSVQRNNCKALSTFHLSVNYCRVKPVLFLSYRIKKLEFSRS
jgi:hypothetical protein